MDFSRLSLNNTSKGHEAKMWTQKQNCRTCGGTNLIEVFSFGKPMPLANDWKGIGEAREGCVPVTILWCQDCTLAQLQEVVDPRRLYSNYPYITSRSDTMMQHFRSLWGEIKKECEPISVIEIASNDGWLLEFCKSRGAEHVVGIDPAENLARIANQSGVVTICGLFDAATAKAAAQVVPNPDVIIARHVVGHIDDLNQFVKDLDLIAKKETVVVIEVPSQVDLLENVQFDTAYSEHLSYFSIRSIEALLEKSLFHLHRVVRFSIHGGAIALMLRRNDSKKYPEPMPCENITLADWELFRHKAKTRIRRLASRVVTWNSIGKKVVGFGASAKSTVWVSACGFTKKDIAFIVDSTPQKQGKLSPGTDIPILPESALTNESADVAICFSWNFMSEIEAKNKNWVSKGGMLLNPHSL